VRCAASSRPNSGTGPTVSAGRLGGLRVHRSEGIRRQVRLHPALRDPRQGGQPDTLDAPASTKPSKGCRCLPRTSPTCPPLRVRECSIDWRLTSRGRGLLPIRGIETALAGVQRVHAEQDVFTYECELERCGHPRRACGPGSDKVPSKRRARSSASNPTSAGHGPREILNVWPSYRATPPRRGDRRASSSPFAS